MEVTNILPAMCVIGVMWKYGRRLRSFAAYRAWRCASQPIAHFKLRHTHDNLLEKVAKPLVYRTCGVIVQETRQGCGTITREVICQLQLNKHISGALHVDCAEVAQLMKKEKCEYPYRGLRCYLLDAMKIPRDTWISPSISALFYPNRYTRFMYGDVQNRRFVLVLDRFEQFYNLCEEQRLIHMVSSIALDATRHGTYTVLINVADPRLRELMCTWNGGQKITSIE